tara:strand:+ start:14 stop:760 length:747 start_codon:yes stop_codon:yes gene_type:complete
LNFLSLFKRNLIYKFKKKISIKNDFLNNKKDLDELLFFYGSDKAEIFRLKNEKGHGFSKFYKKYLSEFKNEQINILEIGSYAGASAAAFSKYIPNSKVFCFDVNITNFKYSSDKIFVYGLDIKNEYKVSKILKQIFKKNKFEKFDLIIDDGSHLLSDMLFSFNFFLKHVKKNRFYIIEDFKHPNYYKYNKDTNEILIDNLLKIIPKKEYFHSKIMNKNDQEFIFNEVKKIDIYKGNLKDSDICFITKK